MHAFLSPTTHSAVLVRQWTSATLTGLVLAAVTGILLSLCLEALKCYGFTRKMMFYLFKPPPARVSLPARMVECVIHVMDVLLGYVLMLIVMTYNIYIFIATVIGSGLGYFLIRPILFNIINARLRRRKQTLEILGLPAEGGHQCGIETPEDGNNLWKRDPTFSMDETPEEESLMDSHNTDSDAQCRQFTVKGKETAV